MVVRIEILAVLVLWWKYSEEKGNVDEKKRQCTGERLCALVSQSAAPCTGGAAIE